MENEVLEQEHFWNTFTNFKDKLLMNIKSKETHVEKYLCDKIKILGGWSIKLLPFLQSGLPDRMVLIPGGRVYFVELKRPKGGRVSPIQKIVFAKFGKLGFKVHILNNKELIDNFINNTINEN